MSKKQDAEVTKSLGTKEITGADLFTIFYD